jgi:guanylate kinase
VDELERRLRGRGTDAETTIARRLGDSVSDMRHWDEFDYVIVNQDLARAVAELEAILDGDGERNRGSVSAVRDRVERMLAGR